MTKANAQPSAISRSIAHHLQSVRKARGLSLDKTAQLTGVSKAMLGQIERGESSPTIATLWKIATGLACSFSSFLSGDETAPTSQHAELDEMVAKIEMETGSPVGKKAKADLKQEIQTRLLPQAFTKNTYTHGFISLADNLVVVDASSDGKAEAFLAMVRKAIGSLPVVPFTRRSLQSELTHWVTESTPEGVGLLEEAELKSTDDTGSVIRCKNQPLDSEEISIHLDAGKLVQKVAFEYAETLTAIMCEDGAIKRVKFTDRIKEETDDVPKDQVEARLDAEFALMSAEICTLLNFLRGALNLNDDSL
jgi:recombination associated protein RdgC